MTFVLHFRFSYLRCFGSRDFVGCGKGCGRFIEVGKIWDINGDAPDGDGGRRSLVGVITVAYETRQRTVKRR